MAQELMETAKSKWAEGLTHALARLDAAGPALVARTEAWAAINSGSRELDGLARTRAVLCDAFAVLPGALACEPLADTEAVGPDGRRTVRAHGEAIRVTVRPTAPLKIALTGHYDTVFAANHPFQQVWREGADTLRGPGVADMKGGLSVMLAALEAFEALPGAKRIGYEVLLSPDEEIGSPASAPLLADLGARAQLGMTYEPAMAGGALVSARKGSGNYALVFRGRAAHVGRAFADGRNAVIAAARTALAIDALNGARAGVTFNVSAIEGGGPPNIVPDTAVLRFNVRAPDAQSAAWAQARLEDIAAAPDGDVSVEMHGAFSRPPKPINPAQERLMEWTRTAGAALGLALDFSPSGGVCEGNNLAAAGCPNIDTLGPCGGALHSADEFARISSFSERAKLSFLLLAGIECAAFEPAELRP